MTVSVITEALTPTEQTPSECICKHYRDYGWCTIKKDHLGNTGLCRYVMYEQGNALCPDYEPKEKKDAGTDLR